MKILFLKGYLLQDNFIRMIFSVGRDDPFILNIIISAINSNNTAFKFVHRNIDTQQVNILFSAIFRKNPLYISIIDRIDHLCMTRVMAADGSVDLTVNMTSNDRGIIATHFLSLQILVRRSQ